MNTHRHKQNSLITCLQLMVTGIMTVKPASCAISIHYGVYAIHISAWFTSSSGSNKEDPKEKEPHEFFMFLVEESMGMSERDLLKSSRWRRQETVLGAEICMSWWKMSTVKASGLSSNRGLVLSKSKKKPKQSFSWTLKDVWPEWQPFLCLVCQI